MEGNKGCPKCGRTLEEDVMECPYCGYKFDKLKSYYKKVEKQRFDINGKYAGIIKRFIALNIDLIFIFSFVFLYALINTKYYEIIPYYYYFLITIFLFIFYKIFSEAIFSKTIGKKIVGIEIIKEDGKISFSSAFLRNIFIVFDFLTLGIGIILSLFDKKKRMLHDIMSKTIVINKEEVPLNDDYAPFIIRLFAFFLDLALIYGLIYLLEIGFAYVKENFIFSSSLILNEELIKKGTFIIISFAYFVCSESGSGASSLGKKILGIRVENVNGHRLTFFESFVRTFCLFLEIVTFGYLLCLVDNKKQTLKDKIVSSKVIRI